MSILFEYWDPTTQSWAFDSLMQQRDEGYEFVAAYPSVYGKYIVVTLGNGGNHVLGLGSRCYLYPGGTKPYPVRFFWELSQPKHLTQLDVGESWMAFVRASDVGSGRIIARFTTVEAPQLENLICPVCSSSQHPVNLVSHVQSHTWAEVIEADYGSQYELMLEVYERLLSVCVGMPADGWEMQMMQVILHEALKCAEIQE